MYTEPFNSFFTKNNIELKFSSAACWRGYYGTWEIRDRKLFLTNIKAYLDYNNSVFWLIGSQEHSILKHEKFSTLFSDGVDEIFTRITHFCRKWNDRWRGNHYGLKNPLF